MISMLVERPALGESNTFIVYEKLISTIFSFSTKLAPTTHNKYKCLQKDN